MVALLMKFVASSCIHLWSLRDRVALLFAELFGRTQDSTGSLRCTTALLELAADSRAMPAASRASVVLSLRRRRERGGDEKGKGRETENQDGVCVCVCCEGERQKG